MGKLIVNTGSMFSGKSTLLIGQGEKHIKAGQMVLYIKPSLDTRYSENEIVTHDGERVPAIRLNWKEPVLTHINPLEIEVLLIDEVQFFDEKIVNAVEFLLQRGVTVYASGLDMDYLGNGFKTTMELMALADKVNKLKAVCCDCGGEAIHSFRTSTSKELVELGEKESYKPVCRKCFYKNMVGE